MTVAELLAKHGIKIPSTAPGRYYTTCPQCSAKRASKEHRAAKVFGVTIENDDSVHWGCNHCGWTGPEKGGGGDGFAVIYDYAGADGSLLFQKVRKRPGQEPRFLCRRPDGKGDWIWNTKGIKTKPLYRWPEILDAMKQGQTIAIAEGEKDCDNLWCIGIPATCNFDGAADITKNSKVKSKWNPEYSAQLRGADLIVLNDNDPQGFAHAEAICRMSNGFAKRVQRLDLAPHWPDMPKGGDVSDWLAAGHTGEELEALIAGAPDYVSAKGQEKLKVDPSQGAALLDDVNEFLARFVVYPSGHAQIAHVLWIAHAHAMSAWESTPRIAFLSPEPASGKTRSIEVAELLVPNPVAAVNVTPAYLFRKVGSEDGPPTILFDEIDTVFGPKAKENEEIRALLNSGHRRGAVAGRCVVRGKTVETEEISSYAAVALAGLGWLPDTILSRSVIIRMRRRAPDEVIEPFRRRVHAPIGEALRRRLAGWAAAVLDAVTEARPHMPTTVEDRNADIWEPLLAIADAAGGAWPKLARKAAEALVAVAREVEPSLSIRLLADLRIVFGGEEQLTTKKILAELYLLEDAPWNDIKGKPLSDNQLARRLRQYGVKSKVIRIGNSTPRGYSREDLHDVWRRYLPPPSSEKPATPATSATSQSFQWDSVAPWDATEPQHDHPEPQHDSTDVAPVAPDVAACCASPEARNADETGVVAPVALVAPLRGNGGEEHVAATESAVPDHGPVCAFCRRPGGNRIAYDDAEVRLHRECEDAWIERRMGEEGI